ncbi:hypothetical protein C2S51_017380 [Perilla frutescens var. frutescens]|nr:hypothetical protein C2S51_017380 [Perilla frutescens var. frutescens]
MFSSAEIKRCGICSQSVGAGQGEALFTAECSHCFHFSCINNYGYVYRLCPVCNAKWIQLPFVAPVHSHPFQRPFNQFVNEPAEPLQFFDDEPLPHNSNTVADPMSVDADSHKVTIKAIPERPAVAAAQSASLFAVLVGLKAPSLSDDARSTQSQRAPLDIVTVLDVSGSMNGMKLNLVKRAVHFVIDNLGDCDRLSIVSFSDHATRVLPLKRMSETGRQDARRAVDLLRAGGGTNIVEGLTKGARVLEERRFKNPVATIIFLSDGNDTYNLRGSLLGRNAPEYLHFLPPSIFPRNQSSQLVVPVHSFGFGSDHDPITMHAISEASGGTFSFIESYEMVQDAFASCIGGLMSVVTHELRLKVRSASHGVEIKSIPSGRYRSEVSNQGSQGLINVGDLYADEEKEFLINLSIPIFISQGEDGKTSLLDITCSYKDAVSKQVVEIEGDLVEIKRPEAPTPQDMAVNLEVDRQRNRLRAAESIQKAQEMAEAGNLTGAKELLAKNRDDLMESAAGRAGDGLIRWLEGEMKETERRMGSARMYEQSGRAYAMAGMSSHASQRATSRGNMVAGAAAPLFSMGVMNVVVGSAAPPAACFGGYATPQMANMVKKSRQQSNEGGEGNTSKKE